MNNKITTVSKRLLGAVATLALLAAAPVHAGWKLNNDKSSISYLSTKVVAGGAASVAEENRFTKLTGSVDDDGNAVVSIDLSSVETNIPIRNERMLKFVFEVADFPEATIKAKVSRDLTRSGVHATELPMTLSLHGIEKELNVPVLIAVDGWNVSVVSTKPVLLNAAEFGFEGGLKKLTEIAGLLHIPYTVPVSFNLSFGR